MRRRFERFFKALINLCPPVWLLLMGVRCSGTNASLFCAVTGRFMRALPRTIRIFSFVRCAGQNGSFREVYFCSRPLKMDKPISKSLSPDSWLSVVFCDGEMV